ncbi:MAG: DJ-1/PfpI family protein [Mycobacterium sp.]|uniref:DJ-1/PfpI family protein n=2 Tax=Mycobacterium sp. TaxID=1785 RepID=UPI003BB49514
MADHPELPRTHRIGILVFDGFEPIDVFGFAEPFSIARFLGQGYSTTARYPFETVLIANEVDKVTSMNGPSVLPDWDCARALEEPLDVLMVPGGAGVWRLLGERPDGTADPAQKDEVDTLLGWIRLMDEGVPIMASVCIGAAVLAKSGLLDGVPAATNHSALDWIQAHYGPRVLWDYVARWVDADKYVTSAGVSAGTDLGFYLVSRLAGRAVAEIAAKAAEYDWHRDPNQPIHYPEQPDIKTTF